MATFRLLRTLGPIDLRSVGRDNLLRWMIIIPVVLAVLARWGLPLITSRLETVFGFDLSAFYPFILSYFFVLMLPMIFGVLIGFLLLDERDDDTLTALQVTPMTPNAYLAYRISIPLVLSFVLLPVLVWLTGLTRVPVADLLLVSVAAAPLAPIFALFLAAFAENKVQGFALMKGLGAVLIIPMASYFVDPPLQYLFGVFPTYWPVKLFWELGAGSSNAWVFLVVGLAYQGLVLAYFLRRFNKVLYR
ncbi:MAG: ABC transporter permease [Anaerolineales bacterium]|nr:ABC transporter permease [Anaerolineales bacterium]